jgi:hypothetical protein
METNDLERTLLEVIGGNRAQSPAGSVWGATGNAIASIEPDSAGGGQTLRILGNGAGGATSVGGEVGQSSSVDWLMGAQDQSAITEGLSRLRDGMDQLRITTLSQMESVTANTDAVAQNTASQGSKGGNSTVSALGKIFSPLLKATGISPVISGIAHLFGGGETESVPLTRYVAPAPIHYEGVIASAAQRNSPGADSTASQSGTGGSGGSSAATIQVNVQTMDSRSFMDHSDQIASAVRDAMLRSHALNDVVSEV